MPVNFSEQGSEAVDLNVYYDFDTEWGQFQYGFSGTYMSERYSKFLPESPKEDTVGTLNGPNRVKARSWLNWSQDDYGATLNVNYSDSYDARRESGIQPPVMRIHHYVTYDLTAYREFDGGWMVNAGCRNLTGARFPFVDNRTPYDPRRVDIQGRVMYLEVSKSFDLL